MYIIYLQVVHIAGQDRAVHGGTPLRSGHHYRQQLRLKDDRFAHLLLTTSITVCN